MEKEVYLRFLGCAGYSKKFNQHKKGEVEPYPASKAKQLLRDHPGGFAIADEPVVLKEDTTVPENKMEDPASNKEKNDPVKKRGRY